MSRLFCERTLQMVAREGLVDTVKDLFPEKDFSMESDSIVIGDPEKHGLALLSFTIISPSTAAVLNEVAEEAFLIDGDIEVFGPVKDLLMPSILLDIFSRVQNPSAALVLTNSPLFSFQEDISTLLFSVYDGDMEGPTRFVKNEETLSHFWPYMLKKELSQRLPLEVIEDSTRKFSALEFPGEKIDDPVYGKVRLPRVNAFQTAIENFLSL